MQYEQWLTANEHRIDFSSYQSAEEIEQVVLERLPSGSAIDEVRRFCEANNEYAVQECTPQKLPREKYGVMLFVGIPRPGTIITRNDGMVRIELHLNRKTHPLEGVKVDKWPFLLTL